jgi:methylenetetrahydrofolate--tRNA-(uracil-5-)-methyltransferase
MNTPGKVRIIGGGLAGCEAAWQCAKRGVKVDLYEMRPAFYPPAHKTDKLAELVCSNSLKSLDIKRSAGLLKNELRQLGSLLLAIAEECAIAGGASLVVDRDKFSDKVTDLISSDPNMEMKRELVSNVGTLIDSNIPLIVACGPNTTSEFWSSLERVLGSQNLYFFDATSPIVDPGHIDRTVVFEASRYDKGEGEGYLNIPLNRDEYISFHRQLVEADTAPLSPCEDMKLFEGCMPVEELAKRGIDTLRYGTFKPVGLLDPRDGSRPYAVIQLRNENALQSAYSIVGFQTRLTQPAQERIIRLLPGMSKVRISRYGRMHRNNYIDCPRLLKPTLESRLHRNLYFAGQVTGLEGYQAAILTGLIAGINAARNVLNQEEIVYPTNTVIGESLRWLTDELNTEFRPTAPVFGMWKDVPKIKKNERLDWYIAQSNKG